MNVRNDIESLSQVFPETTPAKSANSAAAGESGVPTQSGELLGDKARLSSTASQIAQSAASSAVTSDVRLDKVASIQSALRDGSYKRSRLGRGRESREFHVGIERITGRKTGKKSRQVNQAQTIRPRQSGHDNQAMTIRQA